MAQIEPFADIIAEKRRQADEIERDVAEKMKRGEMISDCYARELVADIRREADRLEAAHKRELSKNVSKNGADFGQLGDCAKLREALIDVVKRLEACVGCDHHTFHPTATTCDGITSVGKCGKVATCATIFKARAALAATPRNCDVGDAVEQTERFRRYCDKYLLDRDEGECVGCPLVNMAGYCEFNWSQLPYESEVVK